MPPGPIPNRSENLSRKDNANRANRPPLVKGVLKPVTIPEPDPEWHPIARMMWDSLARSGQSDFYQDSDWAYAYNACEELDKYKRAGRRSAQMFAALQSCWTNLMFTEGDRRRLRIELGEENPEAEDASITAITALQDALKGGKRNAS